MALTSQFGLQLDVIQSVGLIWGAGTSVWNFFSKAGLQPSAAVYFANCAIYSGDSDGWRDSLRVYAAKHVHTGFQIGELSIGKPGADCLPELLDTEYGTRWLGILSVLATLPNVNVGAVNLQRFVQSTASASTLKFALDLQQCERIWTLSREIFFGSPYWWEILDIAAKCIVSVNGPGSQESVVVDKQKLLDHIYPQAATIESGHFFPAIMKAAIGLWQLSRKPESSGRTLWARGSTGCAQLIFYLTVVCGFRVSLSGCPRASFGASAPSEFEIIIENMLGEDKNGWVIGYWIADESLHSGVKHVLSLRADTYVSENLDPHTHRSTSDFQIDLKKLSSPGVQYLNPALNSARREIQRERLQPNASRFLRSYLHFLIYNDHVRTSCPHRSAERHESALAIRASLRSERVSRSIRLIAPGILSTEDHEALIDDVCQGRQATPRNPSKWHELFVGGISEVRRKAICPCRRCWPDSDEDISRRNFPCRLLYLRSVLSEAAREIWLSSYVAINPHLLCSVRYDQQGISSPQCLGGESYFTTDDMLGLLAERFKNSGQDVPTGSLGLSVSGLTIGLLTSEQVPLADDPGHLFYILPGSITSQQRRFRHVVQKNVSNKHLVGILSKSNKVVNDVIMSPDSLPNSSLVHRIQTDEDVAYVRSYLHFENKPYFEVNVCAAADHQLWVRKIESCLVKCPRDQLSDDQLASIQILGKEGWLRDNRSIESKRPEVKERLRVIPAHSNTLLQRAILSQQDYCKRIWMTDGCCPYCAIAQVLENIDRLSLGGYAHFLILC